jgi:hypothetical protein
VTKLEGRAEIKRFSLSRDGFIDFPDVVAETTGPKARETIKNLTAVTIGVVAPIRGGNHARIRFKLPIPSEGHPIRI